jgi:Flp pilus assembly protein TadG
MLKRFAKNEKGQAMVEFALITPLLILLLCGIIDFGWIFGNQMLLNNAGRDTARYMAINYDDAGADEDAKDLTATDILTDRLGPGSHSNLDVDSILQYDANGNRKVQIIASYDLLVLTPLLSTILGDDTIRINTDTTMRLE